MVNAPSGTTLAKATPQQLLTSLLSKDRGLREEFTIMLNDRAQYASLGLEAYAAKSEDKRVMYAQDAMSHLDYAKQAERRVIDKLVEIVCS